MELYTRVTRFCLICNYVSRIIDPLASRCAKFRFEPLPRKSFEDKIFWIADKENIQLDSDAMDTLVFISKGDLRAGITSLQASAQYSGDSSVQSDTILEMASLPSKKFLALVWDSIRSRKYSQLDNCAVELQAEGFSTATVLKLLLEELLEMNDERMTDMKKALILRRMAHTDFAMIEGANEDLQFRALLSFMTKTYHERQ
jgi:replication factor C subunit 2/4